MIIAAGALVLLTMGGGVDAGTGPQVWTPVAGQIAQSLQPFVISIDGSAGTEIVAACLVSRGDDAEVVTLESTLPQRREFEATGLSCQIKRRSGTGRLAIEVSKGGRVVSRQVSSGSSAVISISVQ